MHRIASSRSRQQVRQIWTYRFLGFYDKVCSDCGLTGCDSAVLSVEKLTSTLKMKAECPQNTGVHIQDYTVSQPRRPQFEGHTYNIMIKNHNCLWHQEIFNMTSSCVNCHTVKVLQTTLGSHCLHHLTITFNWWDVQDMNWGNFQGIRKSFLN
jgi:hypothetical protein